MGGIAHVVVYGVVTGVVFFLLQATMGGGSNGARESIVTTPVTCPLPPVCPQCQVCSACPTCPPVTDAVVAKPTGAAMMPSALAVGDTVEDKFVTALLAEGRQEFQALPNSTHAGDGADNKDILKGYPGRHSWWYDTSFLDSYAFQFLDVNRLYTSSYHRIDSSVAHPHGYHTTRSARYLKAYCDMLLGKGKCTRVLELGSAYCFHTEKLQKVFDHVQAVEGAKAAVAVCKRDFHTPTVIHRDLRLPLPSSIGTFDIAMNTEVSEHIEPPFAAQLVLSLVTRAPLVWFTNSPRVSSENTWNTLFHCNNQPTAFWTRLFGFYGYKAVSVPHEVIRGCTHRAGLIFYDPSRVDMSKFELGAPEHIIGIPVLKSPISLDEAAVEINLNS